MPFLYRLVVLLLVLHVRRKLPLRASTPTLWSLTLRNSTAVPKIWYQSCTGTLLSKKQLSNSECSSVYRRGINSRQSLWWWCKNRKQLSICLFVYSQMHVLVTSCTCPFPKLSPAPSRLPPHLSFIAFMSHVMNTWPAGCSSVFRGDSLCIVTCAAWKSLYYSQIL